MEKKNRGQIPTHRTAQPGRGNLGSRGNLLLPKGNCFSIHDSFAFFPHLWRQTPTPTHRTAQPQEEFVCCLGEKMKKKMTCRTCVLSFLPHSLTHSLPCFLTPTLLPSSPHSPRQRKHFSPGANLWAQFFLRGPAQRDLKFGKIVP